MKNVIVNGTESKYYKADREGNVYFERCGNWIKMKEYLTHDGYRRVALSRDLPSKHYRVCRIIAETYIPNPENYPMVNHLNSIRNDDNVENLEWCDNSKNQKQRYENHLPTRMRPVVMMDFDTREVLHEFSTIKEAGEFTGSEPQNIGKVCRGERKVAAGFYWQYSDRLSVETSRKA